MTTADDATPTTPISPLTGLRALDLTRLLPGPYAAQMLTELGAETLHEPRRWPEYHEHYYGAFVRDPDGNNVEAVCHTADTA